MDAVFARKDALAAARAKELVMERVTNYARNKIKNLDTSVQKTILAALAGQRVRDLVSDYESGQRVVNVMIANAKSKAVA
jgi:S-adenosylmethionine synthetase